MELLLQFHVVHIGVVMKKVKKKSVRLTKQQVLPLFGLWSLLVIAFCVWFLFCGLYESWLLKQEHYLIGDKNIESSSIGELRTLYNFSYILPDSWINDLSFEQSSESGDMFHSSDKNLSFSIYNYRLDDINTWTFGEDGGVYQAMHRKIDNFNNQVYGSYKCLLTHDITFDGKPAFEKLIVYRWHNVDYVSYSALIYAGNDHFIDVHFRIDRENVNEYFYEFLKILDSIRIGDNTSTDNDIVYPDGTFIVGKDMDVGCYHISVVGNNPYCSIVDSKDVILNSAERKNENQSIERDVYLTEGTKVKLHNCKLIKQ